MGKSLATMGNNVPLLISLFLLLFLLAIAVWYYYFRKRYQPHYFEQQEKASPKDIDAIPAPFFIFNAQVLIEIVKKGLRERYNT